MPAPITSIGNQSINFGTCELGSTFGQIEKATLEATVEEQGIADCFGGFQSYLLLNPGYNFEFSAIFPSTAPLPERGEPVAFPLAGVTGNIISFKVEWEQKGQRKISVTAKQWESIGSNPTVGALNPV